MSRILLSLFTLFFWIVLAGIAGTGNLYGAEGRDIVAKVGDQVITFTQIDTMINSSSMVGLDLPAFGTPERNRVRLTILDKLISANLLYLDALKQGMDKNPVYIHDVKRFADTLLVPLYREKVIVGEIPVTEKEIEDYYNTQTTKGQKLDETVKAQIESVIRMEKFKKRIAALRGKVREGVTVKVDEKAIDPAGDEGRQEDAVVASIDDEKITWGMVRRKWDGKGREISAKDRLEELNKFIDNRIMVKKARAMHLEKDPVFQARVNEFKKTRLINLYRASLIEELSPTEKEIRNYFKKNKDRIGVREVRKIQMVVLKTKKEAKKIRKMIESGKITLYEAARDYSIDPNAKKTLGEMGWVSQGTGFPKLDKLTFSLDVNELGGPVESPVGWHLVKVLEARDAMYQDIEDKATWKRTRRMLIHEKLDDYVAGLRKNEFPVDLYEDVLNRIMQAEVDRIAAQKKAVEKASKGEDRTEKK